jgi:hypothetical protein
MKETVLALLLALAGQSPPSSAGSAAPAALVAPHVRLTPALLRGAWRDARATDGGLARAPLEVSFTEGLRPSTVFGYFIFGEGPTPPTLRRLGALTADQLRFDFPDGRALTFQLDDRGRRLLGRLSGSGAEIALELSRVRSVGPVFEPEPGAPRPE